MINTPNVRRRPKVVLPVTTKLSNQQANAKEEGTYKPLSILTTYENHTGRPIHILERSGMNYTLNPSGLMGREGHGAIRVVRTYRLDASVNIDEVLLCSDDSAETKMLRDAVASRWRRDLSYTEFVVVYTLPLELFKNLDNDVYVRELDVVVTTNSLQGLIHPYSRQGEILRVGTGNEDAPLPGIGFRWITSKPIIQTLYANIGGEILCIDAQCDETLEEGFYIFTRGHTLEDRPMGTVTHLTVEEAMKKYNLTTSYAEARDNRSAEAILENDLDFQHRQQKLELMEKEYNLRLKTIEANEKATQAKLVEMEKKHLQEIENYQHESYKRQREYEQTMLKFNTESEKLQRDLQAHLEKLRQDEYATKRKDYYEERSYARKDSSELVKWAPSLIVGLGLLLPKVLG